MNFFGLLLRISAPEGLVSARFATELTDGRRDSRS